MRDYALAIYDKQTKISRSNITTNVELSTARAIGNIMMRKLNN